MWHVVCTIDNFEEGVAEMKRLVAASAVALLITILSTPSFARRLSENEIFYSRSRKAKIITTGIHWSISRIII